MKKYKDFSNSRLNTEEEKAYLHKLFNNYYSKEHKEKYATVLEEKYQVSRNSSNGNSTNSVKRIRMIKYFMGAAACLLLFFLAWPIINGSGDNIGELVNKYSSTDILKNREIKRGQATNDEFRTAAIQNYNERNYQEAIESYNLVEDATQEDNFWMAMSYFYKKDYKTAEFEFKNLYQAEEVKFKSELKWYYALSLLQNGKKKEAEVVLKEIQSWKSQEVQQLLNALK